MSIVPWLVAEGGIGARTIAAARRRSRRGGGRSHRVEVIAGQWSAPPAL